MSDVFIAGKDVTKSYIPARNVPERIEVPKKLFNFFLLGRVEEVRQFLQVRLLVSAIGKRRILLYQQM